MWNKIFPCLNLLLLILIYSANSIEGGFVLQKIGTERQYFDSLFASDEAQFQRQFEFPFVLMLNDSQKQVYNAIDSLAARKLFIQSYWQRENPNPILPENRMLLNFLNRWHDVKVHFSTPSFPFFDDRAKYYIRYGKPTNWYKDSGGRKTVRFFQDRGVYNYIGNIYSGIPPAIYYNVHPNESWVYRDISQDFVIHFVKEGTQFYEVESLTRALDTGISKNVAWYWSDMIQHRAHLAPALSRAANNALQIENDILTAAFSGRAGPLRKDNRLPHQQILEQKSILESDIIISKSDVPLFIFYEETLKNNLSFSSDIVQFRGTDESTRIEIIFLTPVQNNIIQPKLSIDVDAIDIEFHSLFRDSTLKFLANIEDTIKYPIGFLEQSDFKNLINNQTISLPAQNGDLTLQIKDLDSGKMGYQKKPITVRNFTGPGLMISDIQIFAETSEQTALDFLPIIEKQNVRITPYPYQAIYKSIPVFCYFEIYNIHKAGIEDEFEIELTILSKKEKAGIFKKFFKWLTGSKQVFISIIQARSVIGDNMDELIAIDFSQIDPGKYILEITITDKSNEHISASTRKQISISEE